MSESLEDLLDVDEIVAKRGDATVLHGISLKVRSGEIVGIIGANAAGKSTLVESIMGGVRVVAGGIRFDGKDVTALPAYRRAQLGFGIVPQGGWVFTAMTVRENLRMGQELAERSGRGGCSEELSRTCVEIFPKLQERIDQRAGTMSGGEQRMVSIARALMTNCRLLILDEPSAGLSPHAASHMFNNIAKLRSSERGILVVEQNAVETMRFADRVYVLELGRVVAAGPPDVIGSNDEIYRKYIGAA